MSRSSNSTESDRQPDGQVAEWLLVGGNRLVIAGGLVLATFAVTWLTISLGLVTVGPRSHVTTTFGSGVTAGIFTLITVTLTINQLISSRIFGAPNELRSRYEASIDLRRSLESHADRASSPVSTTEFLRLVGKTIDERLATLDPSGGEQFDDGGDVGAYVSDLAAYVEQIQQVSSDTHPIETIQLLAGSQYARHVRRTAELRRSNAVVESDAAREDLEAIGELLEVLSVARQYFKTITLQQELARISHLIIYTAIPVLLVAIYTPLLYRTGGPTTVPAEALPVVVSGSVAVVFLPLAILVSYLLRISTVMRYTVSVGPFLPPSEWPWD